MKSLFVVEEAGSRKAAPAGDASAEAADAPSKVHAIPQSQEGNPGQVSQKFMDILFKAMEDNNPDGFDYMEFRQSLASLKKMPMDEQTRFQSAFAMAQTLGATPSKLLDSAMHYIAVLNREEQQFEQALAAQKAKQIGSKEEEMLRLEQTVQAKTEQIRQLTAEIEAHQKQAGQLQKEIGQASAKVETTKNDFIASYNALVEQIQADVDSMKKFLK
ncbi:MAG: hypothetical protein KF852_12810 [Saprospiraceae bacterium]|nr:hypothetical protein [Saprospiraceae bacterium]